MGSRCYPHMLLALLVVAVPPMLAADDCAPSSVNTVSISASSFRGKTGHWITKAALSRKISRGITDAQVEEGPFSYDIDITRQSCDDGAIMTATYNILEPPDRVSADYTFFPNIGYYKLHTEKKNWEDARKTCEKEGAHLAIVNSEAEENAIREVMKAHSTEDFPAFIGFHDKFKEGEYVTVFGDPLSSTGHVRWKNGQPDNYPKSSEGEDCGNIDINGLFNDLSCYLEELFVCEQSLY